MQLFYLNQHSTLPTLRVELILDGRFEFFKARTFNNAIQNADVTFSMTDEDGILKIVSLRKCTSQVKSLGEQLSLKTSFPLKSLS